MDDLVYKKPQNSATMSPSANDLFRLPTLEYLQEKQLSELLELAQVRFGMKGGAVKVNLTPLEIHSKMTEAQVLKALLLAPQDQRPDLVLYELSKGNIDCRIANQILASLAILEKIKKFAMTDQ